MSLRQRLAKLVIDPAFRRPELLRMIFAVDDATGIDLIRTLAPFKLVPASRELFTRCFAHFTGGEEISYAAALGLAACAPDPAAKRYLVVQAGEERAHLEHFRTKLSAFGLDDGRLHARVSPAFARLGTLISQRVERGDFVAGVVGNNVIVEGLAICLLEIGCADMRRNSDEIARFMDVVLRDERHHVRFGERVLRRMNERDELDVEHAGAFAAEMWEAAVAALDDLPDVLDALGVAPARFSADVRAFYAERFAGAGIPVAL